MLTLNISLEQGYIEVYCVQRTRVICEEKCLQKYKKLLEKKCKSQNCSWFSTADVLICKKHMLTLNISLEQGYIDVCCVQRTVVICEEKCLKKYKKELE